MLQAEPLIVTRLKTALPVTSPRTHVTSSAAIAGTLDIAELLPLAIVHPAGSESIDPNFHDIVVEEQTWRVILIVKNVPDNTFAATYAAVGALLREIVLALDGFILGDSFDPLKFTARSEPEVAQGFCEFQLEFKTRFTLSTAPTTPTPDNFITFDETYNIDTAQTGEPVAEDRITLPQ